MSKIFSKYCNGHDSRPPKLKFEWQVTSRSSLGSCTILRLLPAFSWPWDANSIAFSSLCLSSNANWFFSNVLITLQSLKFSFLLSYSSAFTSASSIEAGPPTNKPSPRHLPLLSFGKSLRKHLLHELPHLQVKDLQQTVFWFPSGKFKSWVFCWRFAQTPPVNGENAFQIKAWQLRRFAENDLNAWFI